MRDDQWLRIERLLPGRAGYVGGAALDNRRFVEAVVLRYRAGIPWRDLPERFGKGKSVHQHSAGGRKKGAPATRPSGAVAAGCAPRPTRR